MKLKATFALLIWIAPLASPLLPSQAGCESACCMVEVGACHSEMFMWACAAMDASVAPLAVPAVVAPHYMSHALPPYSVRYTAGSSANRPLALSGKGEFARTFHPPQLIPLLI